MVRTPKFSIFLFTIVAGLSLARTVQAASTATLTVVVDGVRSHNSQICMRIFSSERGFPFSATSEVQSGCTRITGSSVKKQFSGLKPGTYAVAVVDDENGDHKLNRDLLGIPQEGFGVSNNPTVSVKTGIPKFRDASFLLKQDTTIRISMKYSLD